MTPPLHPYAQYGFFILFGWLAFVSVACEHDVVAVLGTEKPFTLYGILSPQLDTQWVRVYPIEGRLDPAKPEYLEAHVTSTDLQSGDQRVWKDSLIIEANGMYAHVYWSPFPAAYDHTYRVKARDTDGAVTAADAIVPPLTELVIEEPTGKHPILLPVLVKGEAPRLLKIEVVYGFDFKYTLPAEKIDTLAISYDGKQQKVEEGWRININLSADFEKVQRFIEQNGKYDLSYGILLTGITIRLIVACEAWDPPEGVFDSEVIVQPGTMSNVDNGFGFVGAGYRLKKTWLPPEDVVRAAGFRKTIGRDS